MIVNRVLRLRISSIIFLCCRPPLWWSKMAEHNRLLTLLFHFLFIFLSFFNNKIICILKLSFLMFPSLVESTISLHLLQFLNLLPYSLWILFQNTNLPHLLPFFFVPLELLLPLLLAEGVGGVHHLAPLGRLHLARLLLVTLALRRRTAAAARGSHPSGEEGGPRGRPAWDPPRQG
jgi:hypothetical protein